MKLRDLKFNQKSFLQKTIKQNERGLNDRNLKDSYLSTAVVYEYVSNPVQFLKRTVSKSQLSDSFEITSDEPMTMRDALITSNAVKDSDLLDFMPQNSILGYSLSRRANKSSLEIFYPFFPGHLSFPAKAGEHVWVFYEVISGRKIGYWMCRKPTHRQIDDINYTRLERINDIYDIDRAYRLDGQAIENREFLVSNGGSSSNLPENLNFEDILASSFSYLEDFVPEPAINASKKCGDFQIQGSNNTAITLGTEKFHNYENSNSLNGFGTIGDTRSKMNDLEYQKNADDKFHPLRLAGSIDLVVGKGMHHDIPAAYSSSGPGDFLKSIAVGVGAAPNEGTLESDNSIGITPGQSPELSAIKNYITDDDQNPLKGLEHLELDKTRYLRGEEEADPSTLIEDSAMNCSARIYASALCRPDALWAGFDSYLPDGGSPEGSTVVNYADHVRAFGEETIKLATSQTSVSLTKNQAIIQAGAYINIGASIHLVAPGGARISLLTSGDIEIVPGSGGRIKLGPNATHAILTNPATSTSGGNIDGRPMVSTMGGLIGDDVDPHGGYCPYVLVTGYDSAGTAPEDFDYLTSSNA